MTTPTLKEGDLLIETGIGRMRDGCWCWRARGAGLADFLPYLRSRLAAHRGLSRDPPVDPRCCQGGNRCSPSLALIEDDHRIAVLLPLAAAVCHTG